MSGQRPKKLAGTKRQRPSDPGGAFSSSTFASSSLSPASAPLFEGNACHSKLASFDTNGHALLQGHERLSSASATQNEELVRDAPITNRQPPLHLGLYGKFSQHMQRDGSALSLARYMPGPVSTSVSTINSSSASDQLVQVRRDLTTPREQLISSAMYTSKPNINFDKVAKVPPPPTKRRSRPHKRRRQTANAPSPDSEPGVNGNGTAISGCSGASSSFAQWVNKGSEIEADGTIDGHNETHGAIIHAPSGIMATGPKSRYLEDFVELKQLGEGSFGKVFKVRKKFDGQVYAVKIIRLASGQAQLREVFALAATNNGAAVGSMTKTSSKWGSGFASGSPASMPSISRPLHVLNESTDLGFSNTSSAGGCSSRGQGKPLLSPKLLSPRSPAPGNISRSLSVSALHVSNDSECPRQILRYYNAWSEVDEGSGDSYLYIQTELCDGTLRDAALLTAPERATHFPDERAIAKALRHVLTGLRYLHARGLVHLDLKPSNIFRKGDTYKIGDLGNITTQQHSESFLTSSLGTTSRIPSEGDSRYMAKELLDFDSAIHDLTKADIFSLGASIFEVIRGKRLPGSRQEWHDIRNGVLVFDSAKDIAAMKTPVSSPTAQAVDLVSSKIDLEAFENDAEDSLELPPVKVSASLEGLIRSMMHKENRKRPSAASLLTHPLLQTDRDRRLAMAEALLNAKDDLQRRAIDNLLNISSGSRESTSSLRGNDAPRQPRLQRAVTM